jgi:DNA adenine methylase
MPVIDNPILRYPGSKWRLGLWLSGYIAQIKHHTYLNPYCGSLADIFYKDPSPLETVNDIDKNIVNLFKVIRDHPDELARLIEFTPWDRSEYEEILPESITADNTEYFIRTGEPLEDARRMLIRCWMSFGAKTADRSSWAHNIQKQKKVGLTLHQNAGIGYRKSLSRLPND